MTPQELCKLLTTEVRERLAVVLEKAEPSTADRFVMAATTDWLNPNVQDIFNSLQDTQGVHEHTSIGQLEANAFLAAFQRAYELQHRGRMSGWADAYTQANKTVDPDRGALIKQLRTIGIQVDEEFKDRLLKTGGKR